MNKVLMSALATALLVAGCGGGGGGGGGGGTQRLVCTPHADPEAPNIPVDDVANAKQVLKYVFDTASVETLSYTQGKVWMVDIGKTITGSGTLRCPGGGSANITDADANNAVLQVGDKLSLAFDDCRAGTDSSSPVLNGSMAITVTSLPNGNPYTANSAWGMGLQMEYTNLQTNITAAACGTVNLTINTDGSGTYTGTVSGSRYTVANTNTKRTLGDFNLAYSEPEINLNTGWPIQGGAARLSGSGNVRAADSAAPTINGSIRFEIPTSSALVGTYTDNLGSGAFNSGEVDVTGGNSTALVMTAVDSAFVDLNTGDGTPDRTPWSEILP